MVRRAAEETRIANAVADLVKRAEAVTSRALAAAAHISREHACTWRLAARDGQDRVRTGVISSALYLS
jgi:hypothetical protein